MVFGNPNSPTTITIFSNPLCNPCAKLHNLIHYFPSANVCIRYSFTHYDSESSVINKLFIALYQQYGATTTWDVLSKWYEYGRKKGVAFFSEFDLDIESDRVSHEFNKQEAWANNEFLIGTPTAFVNGLMVEWPYDITDYLYM